MHMNYLAALIASTCLLSACLDENQSADTDAPDTSNESDQPDNDSNDPTTDPVPDTDPQPDPDTSSCSGTIICEDFDSLSTTADLGDYWSITGNAALTGEKPHGEEGQSLVFTSSGGGYNRNFLSLDVSGLQEDTTQLHGRMMIWVDEPGNNGGDFTFVQADGDPKPESGAPEDTTVMYRYRVDGNHRNGTLMANYDTWVDANGDGTTDWQTDCWDHSTVQLPREEWACVEWKFDSEANELVYWLNDQLLDEIHVTDAGEGCIGDVQNDQWTGPESFKTLHLGIEQYHNGVPERTVYIDDIEISDRKLGCPSP